MKGVAMRKAFMNRVMLVIAVTAGCLGSAHAQEWLLNSGASRFQMQTVKANSIFEVHQFTGLDGSITDSGDATVKIDLTSVASGIDVRDVRMRFLLFETYKFPTADVTAKLDMASLQALRTTTRITYPLRFKLALHGFSQEIETPVTVTRLSDKSVSVATSKPIVITADSFGFGPGIAKLSEAVGGTIIATGATFTFDLLFETGDKLPELQAARDEAAKRKTEAETSTISAEACETRFSVISTAGAIYFKTGSAELDKESGPILQSVAEIANRCPAVKIEVTGHTDSVGGKENNRQLSEQRARAVLGFLSQRGVAPTRVEAAGYGDSRPIVPNDSEANRAKNRRIEFRVLTH
jgi:outer membrane protein OmpA-like peptidoglycan-associated protein/polyisoprenoid-binding protein YceI